MKPFYIDELPASINTVYRIRKEIEETRGLTVGDVMDQHICLMNVIKNI